MAFFLALPAMAQEGVTIGPHFGLIFSSASITDVDGNDLDADLTTKVGFGYGINFNYGFSDNYGIHSGLHIVRKGYQRSEVLLIDSLNVNASQDVAISLVEIPVALRGRSNEIGNGIYITGIFGGSLDITTGYKNTFTGYDPVLKVLDANGGTTKNTRLVTPVNLTFKFGLGVEQELDNIGTFAAGVSYHQGLTNLNSRKNFGNQENLRISYLSIDLGYYF
jgi:hypothetical protein